MLTTLSRLLVVNYFIYPCIIYLKSHNFMLLSVDLSPEVQVEYILVNVGNMAKCEKVKYEYF